MKGYLSFLALNSTIALVAVIWQILLICIVRIIRRKISKNNNESELLSNQIKVFIVSKILMQLIGTYLSLLIIQIVIQNNNIDKLFGIIIIVTLIGTLMALIYEPILIGNNLRKQINILDKKNILIIVFEAFLAFGIGLFFQILGRQ